jgi:alkanesulfonate monooxygenase SsuD/methylene tetrahydromethanopterin reductase-like flavin-dependent oxidoreductase (luciferase family)
VTLGVGTGWMREEFEALGAPPFDTRGRTTDNYIRAFRALWAGEDKDVIFLPAPKQARLPIWIGGESDPALRRAARLGDGWYPMGINPRFPLDSLARYKARIVELAALAEKAGRDPGSVALAYWASWYPSPEARASDGARRLLSGADKDAAEDIAALGALGVRTIVLGHASPTVAEHVAKMERFQAEVAALVRA